MRATTSSQQQLLVEYENIKDRFIKKTGRKLIFSERETRKKLPEIKGKTIRVHDWFEDLPPHNRVLEDYYH